MMDWELTTMPCRRMRLHGDVLMKCGSAESM